jgi:hypothetical protein
MKKILIVAAILSIFNFQFSICRACRADSLDVTIRVGYNLGGTMPTPLPASIRSIDAFHPTFSPTLGADIILPSPFGEGLGVRLGLIFENKGMHADVTVKGYRMEMKKGASQITGLFTGHVSQQVSQWMLTMPINFQFSIFNFQFRLGPYLSLLVAKEFSGIASSGYLRQGDPTGPKIDIGDKEGEWATYDFGDDMRSLQWGLGAGMDWLMTHRLGLSLDVRWGLSGIFESSFKTVEQTLHPIYGTLGVFYKL